MNDDDPIEGAPPPAIEPATDPAPPAERTFSQAEVEGIVRQRLQRDRQTRAAQPAPVPQTRQPADTKSTATETDLAARLDTMERQRAFDYAAAPHSLSQFQADMLFRTYESDQSGLGADEWIEDAVKRSNFASATPANTAAATPPPATAAVSPSAGPPRPVNHLASGEMIDVTRLTAEEIATLGPQGIRREFEKTLAEAHSRIGAPRLPGVMRKKE